MTLQSLIARVESGSGSDRVLDAEIIQALYPGIGDCRPHCPGDEPIFYHDPFHKMPAPHLTSSLDAVRALLKARLDEPWFQVIEDEHPNNRNPCAVFVSFKAEGFNFIEAEHHDIHRAFLSATLKAIAAKEG